MPISMSVNSLAILSNLEGDFFKTLFTMAGKSQKGAALDARKWPFMLG